MLRVAAFTLTAVVGLATAMGPAKSETIVFNSFAPPQFVINQGMIDVWAKDVDKNSQGRLKVTIPAQSLAAPQQQWEMVTQGVADGAYIANVFAQKRLLLPQIGNLPFFSPTGVAMARALWHIHKEMFEKANEHKGVHFLGYFGAPAPHIFSLNKPFTKIDDLKDVKTWSLPGDQSRALAALGAVIVPGPAVRSYEIISKGIVEAFGGQSIDSSYQFNIAQFAKSVTMIPGGMGGAGFSVFMNQQKWDGLSKQDQDVITNLSGEQFAFMTKVWDDRDVKSQQRMHDEGKIEMLAASPELVKGLHEKWVFLENEWIEKANTRHIDGKAALARFKELLAEYSK